MREWITQQWAPACQDNTLLILDVHKAQATSDIEARLAGCRTTQVFVPPGATSLVQPLDVCINAPFKAAVSRLANEHVADNLEKYVQGSIPAGERRILLTRWVGQAWDEISTKTGTIIWSFRKCAISVPIDGSADEDINIQGFEAYVVEEKLVSGAWNHLCDMHQLLHPFYLLSRSFEPVHTWYFQAFSLLPLASYLTLDLSIMLQKEPEDP